MKVDVASEEANYIFMVREHRVPAENVGIKRSKPFEFAYNLPLNYFVIESVIKAEWSVSSSDWELMTAPTINAVDLSVLPPPSGEPSLRKGVVIRVFDKSKLVEALWHEDPIANTKHRTLIEPQKPFIERFGGEILLRLDNFDTTLGAFSN